MDGVVWPYNKHASAPKCEGNWTRATTGTDLEDVMLGEISGALRDG